MHILTNLARTLHMLQFQPYEQMYKKPSHSKYFGTENLAGFLWHSSAESVFHF